LIHSNNIKNKEDKILIKNYINHNFNNNNYYLKVNKNLSFQIIIFHKSNRV